jgi:hypothetical protein
LKRNLKGQLPVRQGRRGGCRHISKIAGSIRASSHCKMYAERLMNGSARIRLLIQREVGDGNHNWFGHACTDSLGSGTWRGCWLHHLGTRMGRKQWPASTMTGFGQRLNTLCDRRAVPGGDWVTGAACRHRQMQPWFPPFYIYLDRFVPRPLAPTGDASGELSKHDQCCPSAKMISSWAR